MAMTRHYLRLLEAAIVRAYHELNTMVITPDSKKEAMGLGLFEWIAPGDGGELLDIDL